MPQYTATRRTISPVYALLIILLAIGIAAIIFVRSTSEADCSVEYAGTVSKNEALDAVRNVGRCS